jgi:hypothetical protein
MEKFHVHVGELAVYGRLAGMVEFESLEIVSNSIEDDVAARFHVRHDEIPCIFDLQRSRYVVELDRLELLVQVRTVDIDW